MRAATFRRYGPPATLALQQVALPVPAEDEIRVRVHHSTVTRTDTATLRAHPFFARLMTGMLRPKMHILGMDFAGVVDTVGSDVAGFRPGDKVFGLLPDRFGGHAQYVCVAQTAAIAHVPDNIPLNQAVVAEGAWYASSTTKRLSNGQSCLIYGASGAIGTAAVQLAKIRGAHVTAVVGHKHMDLAASLGADRVINYQVQDFTGIDDKFDLVFDAVGKTSWFACRRLLKKGGAYAATDLGPYWSNIVLGVWYALLGSGRVSVPFPQDAPGFVRMLARHMAQGKFSGVFDRSYPLADIVSAFTYVEGGQKTGVVVVDIP